MPCLDEAGAEAGVAREAEDGDGGEAPAHLVRQRVEVVVAEVQRREAAPAPQRALIDDCEADNDDDDAAGGARFFFFFFCFFCRPAARQSPRAGVGCDGGDAAAATNAGVDARLPLLRQGGVSGGESSLFIPLLLLVLLILILIKYDNKW